MHAMKRDPSSEDFPVQRAVGFTACDKPWVLDWVRAASLSQAT